ncbi:UDP-N-acetylglucosamine acyltransferase [Lentzea albidocapillata subsp. violacea]|uniref:UDP-N-acetylglucosamine acyltransferase n=1 Tax=Lentzea albidocapillata subsp. violacea TaxID=128104 RepID=A0A1G9DLX5_9PSEU|nr:UDP-N-acetylglucosamine acyltransferase [Lentzea albidocapillata]SDK64842.1 UDP-N-acetylglucosamine acyltransferase [Lentzea albidocapillata subsp. violacea]
MANRIHETAIIGAEVEFGDDNVVGPYTVIAGPCRIGDGNFIGPHVSIGGPAEYLSAPHVAGWDGEVEGPGVVIGDRNRIREFVTINQGVSDATRIGSDNYVMGRAHIAHDCVVDNSAVITSAVQIAGHCRVWSGANIGLGTVVHQGVQIGPGAMVGLGSAIRKEVGAFTITLGNPARTTGVNVIGLQRRGCTEELIAALTGFLTGKEAEVPAGLPEELATLLKAWNQRADQH